MLIRDHDRSVADLCGGHGAKAACYQVDKRSFGLVGMEELSSRRSYSSAMDQTLFLS